MEPLTTDEFDDTLASHDVPVVIDFWASWCGPCKVAMPKLQAMSEDFGDSVAFYKVNVDKEGELAARYKIRSIPTFLVFVDGELERSITGDVGSLRNTLEGLVDG